MKELKRVQLEKGQILVVDFIRFDVVENCELVIKGDDISNYYPSRDFVSVAKYSIECDAIIINDEINSRKRLVRENLIHPDGRVEPIACVSTATDIGGHFVYITDTDDKLHIPVAFLHNGFGDGRYTLRFVNGRHFR